MYKFYPKKDKTVTDEQHQHFICQELVIDRNIQMACNNIVFNNKLLKIKFVKKLDKNQEEWITMGKNSSRASSEWRTLPSSKDSKKFSELCPRISDCIHLGS